MAFNWFRRQFDSCAASPPEASPNPQEKPAQGQPPSKEALLEWAKAAYQNVQKQAQGVEEAVVVTSPGEAESIAPPETAVSPSSAPESDSKAQASLSTEPIRSGPEPEINQLEETPSASRADPNATLTPPLPAWAQTTQLNRLERLKATAIPEPEPQTMAGQPTLTGLSQAPVNTSVAADLTLGMDEGFLWSAEVLAAQGRRPEEVSVEEITWLQRLRQGLGKSRRGLFNQLKAIVGQGPLSSSAVQEIEDLLLQADVGIEATEQVVTALQAKLRQETLPPEAAINYLKDLLRQTLDAPYQNRYTTTFAPEKDQLNVWLITGVNGAGKTTTVGKIAHLARKSEFRCLIAAADTFRAAAVQQVEAWGDRSGVEVIANPAQNSDPAAVVFDAIAAAQARNTELLLVDTAGRLQNKKNLMEELSKIRRIIDKKAPTAKVESLLVLDATLGQNGLRQAEVFAEVAQLSGVVLTKLDGTAKGGAAIAVVQQLGLPIRFLGVGEGIEDLRPFSSYEFVEALLSN